MSAIQPKQEQNNDYLFQYLTGVDSGSQADFWRLTAPSEAAGVWAAQLKGNSSPEHDDGDGECQQSFPFPDYAPRTDAHYKRDRSSNTSKHAAAGLDSTSLREKNRIAQIKYRARRREREHANEQAVEQLSQRMAELEAHNRELDARERLMTQVVQAQERHIDRLSANQLVQKVAQAILIEEVLLMMSKVYGRTVSQDEAFSWGLAAWTTTHFPRYLDHLAKLLPAAESDPCGPEAQELTQLVTTRREVEIKHALFSNLHLAMFAWNLNYARHIPMDQRPTQATWATVLEELKLTPQQQDVILHARSRLLRRLALCSEERLAAYSAVGLDLAALPKDQIYNGRGAAQLHAALNRERKATVNFLQVVTAETLTPLQEAWLDAQCSIRPWWPDIYAMCNALAEKHGQEKAPAFPVLTDLPSQELRELVMPMFTPFQLLITPCTALGAGIQLKRAQLYCTCQSTGQVSPAGVYYQMPSMESLEGHSLSEISVGNYRTDWRRAPPGFPLIPRYGIPPYSQTAMTV